MFGDVAQVHELFIALVRVALARARLSRQPIDAVWTLNQAQGVLLALRDRDLHAEAFRTGRSFHWRGEGRPTRENIACLPPPKFSATASASLDAALCARARTMTQQRPRERRERRLSRTVGSRGDPSPAESDDEDLAPSPDEEAA
jgi:hypothetical protein